MSARDLSRERDTRYVPYPVPDDYSRSYLEDELRRLQIIIENLTRINMVEIHQAVDKPRSGDFIFIDGIDFDPNGQGQGVYIHINGTYRKFTITGPVTVDIPETSFTLEGNIPAFSNP